MKKALVIGGSSGIGLEFIKLIKNDYITYNVSRRKCIYEEVYNIECDLSQDINELKLILNKIDFDLFAYFAGESISYSISEVDVNLVRRLFEVNYFKVIEIIKAIIPNMIKREIGNILLISSISSKLYIPFDTYYCASKAALNLLNDELNIELNKYNIYSKVFLIGSTKTNFSFNRKISKNEYLYENFSDAISKQIKLEQNGMNKKEVANKIYSKINKTKAIYIIGLKAKIYYYIYKLLPNGLIDYIIRKIYKLN